MESPFCSFCNNIVEDNHHYFFVCPLYYAERNVLFAKVNNILKNRDTLNTDIFLNGSEYIPLKENISIMELVEKYIHDTGRFQTK